MVFTGDEKRILNEAVEILQPFYDANNEISGSTYPTISIVIPLFQSIAQTIQFSPHYLKRFSNTTRKAMLKSIKYLKIHFL